MSPEGSATILIVDDEPDIVELLANAISNMGNHRVVTALSGRKALDIIEKDPPDMVLLDIMMDGIDGMDVCRAIRSDEETEDMPVIAVTAIQKASEKFRDIMDSGVDDYLEKPLDFDELKEIVEYHLRLMWKERAEGREQ